MSDKIDFSLFSIELMKYTFDKMKDKDICEYCGLYDTRELSICINAKCPTLFRQCSKRKPYYEAKNIQDKILKVDTNV